MVYATQRRRRRRRWWLGLGALLVILIGGFFVTRSRSEGQATREYLDLALEVTQIEAEVAQEFVRVVTGLDSLERPLLVETLDEMVTDVERMVGRIELADPPDGTLTAANASLRVAVTEWRDGIVGLREALLTMTESPLDPLGPPLLARAFIAIRVGDSAYEDFLRLAGSVDDRTLIEPLPDFTFVPPDDDARFYADDVQIRLLQSPTLGVNRDIAVADLSISPTPVSERDGIPVVPASDPLDIAVTVVNRGNVAQENISVVIELLGDTGAVFTQTTSVGTLEPGELTGLEFTGLPVEPGGLYEVVVALVNVQDLEPDNDRVSFVFQRNAEE